MGAFGDAIDKRLEELDVARQKEWNRELIEDGRFTPVEFTPAAKKGKAVSDHINAAYSRFEDGRLPFEREGYGVNKSGAWRRLYGQSWGYVRDFGWRSVFRGTEGGRD